MKPEASAPVTRFLQQELASLADPGQAQILSRFFKTGPGEYGQGDRFRGIKVPVLRKVAGQYTDAGLEVMDGLLHSPWHEDRFLALLLMVDRYKRGSAAEKQAVSDLYLSRTDRVNNWDLVDVSAEHILGRHAFQTGSLLLTRLARSESLWERRMAVMATFQAVKTGVFDETLRLVEMLLEDSEDLIHKAAGWMLREVGKRDRAREETFLRRHYRDMPRTMLRYAIEKFPENLRQDYLKGRI